jgi:glyoxalase family protein
MDQQLITGLHHITSISGSPRNNVRFYTEILGLKFVKKTINYDSPDTWHLYYGDGMGRPGTIITFFPFSGISRGKSGNRSVTSTIFSIDENALSFWMERLNTHHIEYKGPFKRFDENFIVFTDFDGLQIELVANETDTRIGTNTPGISEKNAIKGMYSVTLSYASAEPTLDLLTNVLQHSIVNEYEDRIRLFSGTNQPGHFLDIKIRPSATNQVAGIGTVHHLAFQTPDENTQKKIFTSLTKAGIHASRVMDRQYFKSIYFREPGGVLFEIATAGPGFLIDEKPEELGQSLKLPQWLENQRIKIESSLSPL